MKRYCLVCRDSTLREVPVQVVSERMAEAQAAGQQGMERAHVPVSVAASVEQVYTTIKVTVQSSGAVLKFQAAVCMYVNLCALLGFLLG